MMRAFSESWFLLLLLFVVFRDFEFITFDDETMTKFPLRIILIEPSGCQQIPASVSPLFIIGDDDDDEDESRARIHPAGRRFETCDAGRTTGAGPKSTDEMMTDSGRCTSYTKFD